MFCVGYSRKLMYNISEAISLEVRAFYNDDLKRGFFGRHGLSCFSPVINIMRHPLWGRNQVGVLCTVYLIILRACLNMVG